MASDKDWKYQLQTPASEDKDTQGARLHQGVPLSSSLLGISDFLE